MFMPAAKQEKTARIPEKFNNLAGCTLRETRATRVFRVCPKLVETAGQRSPTLSTDGLPSTDPTDPALPHKNSLTDLMTYITDPLLKHLC
ncbi:hypothetical protein J6590_009120 [Homalodisca vitripennis]|nr:hypothetical protein J6590_009120 [Homalodisca vitripennis]